MMSDDFFSPRQATRRRRILALYFPHLETDLHRRRIATPPDAPLALHERVDNALKIAALDAAAEALGLFPGQPLAEARALAPALAAAPIDRAADESDFVRLLRALLRYSPIVARARAPSGAAAFLDIEGCARLFGGEAALAGDAVIRLRRNGVAARAAVAGTPGCAYALARAGGCSGVSVIPPGGEKAALAPLPAAALRLDAKTADALRSLGLRTIGAIAARGRGGLARRFGAETLRRLDEATGAAFEPLAPIEPPPDFSVDAVLPEPVTDIEPALALAEGLARALESRLEAAGVGARRFSLTLFRLDMSFARVAIVLGTPARAAATVMRLLRLRLERGEAPVDPGFGFERFRLSACGVAPLGAAQADMLREDGAGVGDGTGDTALKDLLVNHLGGDAVFALRPVASHVPERAEARGDAGAADNPWKDEIPRPRPLSLLARPEPITATALAPDGPPASFRWRRISYRVVRAAGPERILGEWRRGEAWLRDYYRVEDEHGRRYWVFREGLVGDGAEWRLHGFFA